MKRIFIVITILVLALTAAVALGMDRSQTALAQAPQPPVVERGGGGAADVTQWVDNLPADTINGGGEIQAYPYRQMSYQGNLVIDGFLCSGVQNITFRLYSVASGGSPMWEETQAVTCTNGLFSVMLGAVTPLPYAVSFQSQLWLGVQPAGAASELTPRQMLGTVGYAMNLMGGATMVDTNPAGTYGYSFWVHSYEHDGIYASSDITDGVGVSGNAYGPWVGDAPVGVSGYADYGYGVEGTSGYAGVKGEGYVGVWGTADDTYSYGVWGEGGSYTGTMAVGGSAYGNYAYGIYGYTSGLDSPAVYAYSYGSDVDCGSDDTFCMGAVMGQAWGDSYAASTYADDSARCAYYGKNDNTFYTGYFRSLITDGDALGTAGSAYIGGDLTVTGAKSGYVADVAVNAGSEPLERGDVVVVVGMDEPILGDIPVMRVQRATAETASGIVGVVDVLYETCAKPADQVQEGEACGGFRHSITTIQPGQHLGVVTLGAFQWLKVDASTPIKAGDLLSISATSGVAAKAQQITIDGYSFYAPGTIIGKALQDLDAGTGYIAVFVSLK